MNAGVCDLSVSTWEQLLPVKGRVRLQRSETGLLCLVPKGQEWSDS